jgi:catechol 2,3-dioxygenase-like lactoylglutathione lyase family enzyme
MTANARADLLRGAPYFPVPDVAAAGEHYRNVLGFECEYLAGEPPVFGIYSRNGAPIMLRRVDQPALIRPNEQQGGTWDVFFWVNDVMSLHAELLAAGATIVHDPVVMPYGMKLFAVRDPNGYVLGFGQTHEA